MPLTVRHRRPGSLASTLTFNLFDLQLNAPDLRVRGAAVAFGYAFRVDRTWQNQNHVSPVQGPIVAIRPARRRVPAA